jgi:hypothetical protein
MPTLLPPLLSATDITARRSPAESDPGQGYLRLEYGAPTSSSPGAHSLLGAPAGELMGRPPLA